MILLLRQMIYLGTCQKECSYVFLYSDPDALMAKEDYPDIAGKRAADIQAAGKALLAISRRMRSLTSNRHEIGSRKKSQRFTSSAL